ncbi:MAG TPA: CheR family methyltransferase, partial [Longimicrobium sp.]|nr:CheR family methyltransferase [Longimicrobium sp.]
MVASLGGLKALGQVLAALPASFPAAVLVMQHLERARVSRLPEILETRTSLRVRAAADGDALRAGTVYVAPAGRHLSIRGRTLALTDTDPVQFSRPSADVLLESLAGAGAPVIAVVLTGRGEDGAAGSVHVRDAGGTVLAQDHGTSAHFGMPGAAVRAGGVNEVLPLDAIAARLVQLIDVHPNHPRMTAQREPARDPQFESLLDFLKASRSFDFTGYKRSTLMRRVLKRMQTVGIDGFDAYRDYLELHAGEFDELFNTILINVTSFFRDADAWDALSREFIPALLARKGADEPVRVWSAGCASGEETYTVVMALAEAMGAEQFRERVKVYATDADNEALATARQGSYEEDDLSALPDGYRDRYFERTGGRWTFRGELRRQVIFGRHDLVQDAPISHLDLLVCRNVLMYFNAEVQGRIMARFHFALGSDGLLFLGKAEMMRSHGNLFAPAHLQARLFRKAPPGTLRERLLMLGSGAPARAAALTAVQQLALRDAALDAASAAQIVVGADSQLLLANVTARGLFALSAADLGRPLQDLTVSYRPVELRSRIDQALEERRVVSVAGVQHTGEDGEARVYDVHVCPLRGTSDGVLGVSVAFLDVTRFARLQAEVAQANNALETAFEELQSTNEELETTNEELQSTV